MAKVKKVKWAVSGEEPSDLAEFKDNETIVKENKGLPAKGVYRLLVRRMFVKPDKNGDDRVSVMLIMDQPKDEKTSSYNGYLIRDGFSLTETGKQFLKRYLKGVGLTWDDFYNRSKEKEDGDRRELVQIGGTKFGTEAVKDVHVKALLKISPPDDYNESEFLEVGRYIPSDDATDEDASDSEEEAADMSGDDDNGDALTLESLKGKKAKALRTLAADNGIKQKKIDKAGKDTEALTALIVKELNLPPF
jgi:hypothetical protein